ncbi:hypothetical protein KI688_008659 [Linnemannia hyalina]|uniref:Uncharacterized protein n=1 Tax=Linnemannia hyalina TaxID=64524 RepID=A0A9P7Y4E6_9FUNG|nr:hypothetical protein KI688_008659 [Linnemannia hyalina]
MGRSKMWFDYCRMTENTETMELPSHCSLGDFDGESLGDVTKSGTTALADNGNEGPGISFSELAGAIKGLLGENRSSFLVLGEDSSDSSFTDIESGGNLGGLDAILAHAQDLSSFNV